MSSKKKSPVVHGAIALVLLAGSAYLTVELRQDEQAKAPKVQLVTDSPQLQANTGGQSGTLTWERLKNPDRSVLRGDKGKVLATFTDDARTATLKGPSRTFSEPANTPKRIVTEDWVRLMPEPWRKGAEKEKWFKDWYKEFAGSQEDDIFAFGFQYIQDAPTKKDDEGIAYAGDAEFGPLNPNGSVGNDLREELSDFYDYLEIPYTFRDGRTIQPEDKRARAVDCSGFMRLMLGYRARYPLASSDNAGGGLPRTANGMARSDLGADVIPLKGVSVADRPKNIDVLQPGDLVFFKLDGRTKERLDHMGIYIGHSTDGDMMFLSSREEVNGPTIGDQAGESRLNGNGYYPGAFRSAKRL
ncbi:C40 family peptidase [Streptomyces sp. NPDC057638]|uniref:C40 family peptidase n=1 Tax=Streptomyces sp. NPDC057638 TaxID=3346190 RepID=UPI00368FCD04